jgi:hypothetical protein
MSLKHKILSATAIDLAEVSPFLNGGDAVAINLTAGALTVQHSDDNSSFSTAVVLSAATGVTPADTIVGLKRYVRLSSAGTVVLIANL